MLILKIIGFGLLILIILIISFWIAAFLTGHTKRAYKFMAPSDTIYIGNKAVKVKELSEEYEPKMFLRSNTPTPKLNWIWYEVVPNINTVDITYYYTWENEINPNPTFHNYYSVFRAAYYGYPLYDIEYFQVSVNKLNGNIQRIRFETSISDNYFQSTVEHFILSVKRDDKGIYHKSNINSKEENLDNDELTDIELDDNRLMVGVQTWNHLSRLLYKEQLADYKILQEAPLKFLSDSEYSKYKFVRKSQGDHKTKENRFSLIIGSIFVFLLLTIPLYFVTKKTKKKEA